MTTPAEVGADRRSRQRIAPVHITDYADPQFGPDVAAMIEGSGYHQKPVTIYRVITSDADKHTPLAAAVFMRGRLDTVPQRYKVGGDAALDGVVVAEEGVEGAVAVVGVATLVGRGLAGDGEGAEAEAEREHGCSQSGEHAGLL